MPDSSFNSQLGRVAPRAQIVNLIERLANNLVNIKDETGEFLIYLDDGRILDAKSWDGWEWTHGVGLYGLFKYYELTGADWAKQTIEEWFLTHLANGTPTKNINTMAPFLTLACVQEICPRIEWLPYLDAWAEWIMNEMPRTQEGGFQHIVSERRNHEQLWDDTLMMTVLPLTKIGLLLDRQHYIEEAKYQFHIHTQYLSDRASGLWYHGWTFDGDHNFANALWGRGNSWITIAIPEFLEMTRLSSSDAHYRHFAATLRRQAATLARSQNESGMWHTLVDDKESYLEASATAGFAYGLLKGVRQRILDKEYLPVAEKAVAAIIRNISDEGELLQVSFGTPMGEDLDFYRNIEMTSMPYGQAMAILCLSEYLRTYL